MAGTVDGRGRPAATSQRDNCFTWLEDPERAQQLMDQQVRAAWPELLNAIAREPEPAA